MKRRRSRPRAVRWKFDLYNVLACEMTLGELFDTHARYIEFIAHPWVLRCPRDITPEDIYQEMRITVAKALDNWDPEMEVPLENYVHICLRFRLMHFDKRHRDLARREKNYLDYEMFVEDKVVAIPHGARRDRQGDPRHVWVSHPDADKATEAMRMAVHAICSMRSAHARKLIAKLIAGVRLEDIVQAEYAPIYDRPLKAAYRHIQYAIEVIEKRRRWEHQHGAKAPDSYTERDVESALHMLQSFHTTDQHEMT